MLDQSYVKTLRQHRVSSPIVNGGEIEGWAKTEGDALKIINEGLDTVRCVAVNCQACLEVRDPDGHWSSSGQHYALFDGWDVDNAEWVAGDTPEEVVVAVTAYFKDRADRAAQREAENSDQTMNYRSRELAQTGVSLDGMPPEAVFGECQRLVSLNGSTFCLPRRWRLIYTELLSARKP